MDRRGFLKLSLAGSFSVILNGYSFTGDSPVRANAIVPPLLKKGSKVAFTAPGSPVSTWEIRQIANFFLRNGCSIHYGETITNRDIKQRYLSRDDKFRADEINSLFYDTSVDCIVAARGGFGSIRVLDLLDYDLIKQNPKIFLGFSDITVILLSLYKKSNLVTFHGPTGNFNLDSFTSDILKTLLFEKGTNEDYCISYNFSKGDVLNHGISYGKLVGGNLSNLVSLLGTEFEFDTDGFIIFLEEISEPPYKIDRMLKHLELAGKFKNCKGVLLGYFGKLDARRNFYPDYSLTLREIFETFFKKYDFPVVLNIPFGHNSKFLTFPIGSYGEINTKTMKFSLNLYADFF